MSKLDKSIPMLEHPDRFFIGGEWVRPASSKAIDVVDSATEEVYFSVPEATEPDLSRAVGAARVAFDDGPWPRMSHLERASYLRAMADEVLGKTKQVGQLWPRETGILHSIAQNVPQVAAERLLRYAGYATSFPFEEIADPVSGGEIALLVREPVGVVGAIVPWNGPLGSICTKIAPALLAGCTIVLKLSPEAPGEGYLIGEVAQAVGLPPGVLNIVTAERETSELLVTDSRVDKITFTGSTATGRRIAALCGERVARCTLELGGKSAAIILDDMDIETAATTLVAAECRNAGQVCASLTRIIISERRHDEMLEALSNKFSAVKVGDPFDPETQMGPLAAERQRDRVLGYITKGVDEGAVLASGGGQPKDLDRGWFVEPTVFGRVSNSFTIAREEIFGPVLSVIPARDEEDAVAIANDSIYGLNASVFTNDVDRGLAVARRLRCGTVGHNAFRSEFGVAFGGYKQSGLGREGGKEGLLPFLEVKTIVLNDVPSDLVRPGVSTAIR